MKRRDFLNTLVLGSIASACGGRSAVRMGEPRRVAITIDDPHVLDTPLLGTFERDWRILTALTDAKVKAALFVCGRRVDSEEGAALLERWSNAGHIIANHSYSHLFYHSESVTPEIFIEDFDRGDAIVSRQPGYRKLFRFPYLKEGDSREKRDRMRSHMSAGGYRNGHVSIDASDWYIDSLLVRRLKEDPEIDTTPYRDFYLEHIRDRALYYDRLSMELLGRSIPHTLLLHHSLLNALFLKDLVAMFRSEGWELVDAAAAYADPVYLKSPDALPAGESLLWSLALESGLYEGKIRYPAEDQRYEEEEAMRRGL